MRSFSGLLWQSTLPRILSSKPPSHLILGLSRASVFMSIAWYMDALLLFISSSVKRRLCVLISSSKPGKTVNCPTWWARWRNCCGLSAGSFPLHPLLLQVRSCLRYESFASTSACFSSAWMPLICFALSDKQTSECLFGGNSTMGREGGLGWQFPLRYGADR